MPLPKTRVTEVRTHAEIVREYTRRGLKATDPGCRQEIHATVRMMMELGWDVDTMCVEFGVTQTQLMSLTTAVLAKERQTVEHRPTIDLYVEYRLQAMSAAAQLEDIAHKAKKAGEYNAATNATRARFQILDKTMDRGQELGIVPRAPKRTESVGGILVATMSDVELLAHLRVQHQNTASLVSKYGSGGPMIPFVDVITMGVEDVYTGVGDPSASAGLYSEPEPTPETAKSTIKRTKVR